MGADPLYAPKRLTSVLFIHGATTFMARLPRLNLPGQVHLVSQRGHNGEVIVRDDQDRSHWLALLQAQVQQVRLAVHGYVLLDQGFHLLVTPPDASALPHALQALGRAYVRYFNNRHARSGTLWDGRYRSTVLQAERYLLSCLGLMDRLPVQQGLVKEPLDHVWGSHRGLVGIAPDRMLTPHALYWALGNTPFAREASYAEMVRTDFGAGTEPDLGRALQRSWALGDAHFVANLQAQTTRRVAPLAPGRPARRAG